MVGDAAIPRSRFRLRAGCCHRPGGSSAKRDHDDNPLRPWSRPVGDRHDRQGRGCPGAVPGGSRFGLRYAEILGLSPCTRRCGPKLAITAHIRAAAPQQCMRACFGCEGEFHARNPHRLLRHTIMRTGRERNTPRARGGGGIPSARHPAISHRRVWPVNSTSLRVPRCRLWPIAQSSRRPRYRRCCASPPGVRVVCGMHWPSCWGNTSRQWAAN